MRPFFSHLLLLGSLLLAALFGWLIGRMQELKIALPEAEMRLVPDMRSRIPVVHIEGIRDGKIVGTISGSGRVFFGDDYVVPGSGGMFSVPSSTILREMIDVHIPPGMNFVASRKGKKFYPIRSASANKIIPENRVYFKTAKEAKERGFVE